MAIKIKIARRKHANKDAPARAPRQRDAVIRIATATFIIVATLCLAVFAYFYIKYERIIDRRMSGQVFSNTAKIYALPKDLKIGDRVSPQEVAAELRRAGYSESGKGAESKVGRYRLLERGIEIRPGPGSYHSEEGAVVQMASGKVSRIMGLSGSTEGRDLSGYELEPQLITALFDSQNRAKRQIVKFREIPKVMVDAVLAIEDRRFFQHSGVNYFRLAQAALYDLRERRHGQGGSTITMQISRAFFLTPQKTVKRKLVEILIAIELEQKFSKEQIFEFYANQVDLGQRGSFTISGFAEGAHAYFNKDLPSLSLPEAALLAGIIQRPSYLNPYRHPERALERRNLVLESMVETGAITRDDCERAKAAPLKLAAPNVEASDAPYFVDLVKDTLTNRYSERDLNEEAFRIYTTLDPDLQSAAADAVQVGLKEVDAQVHKLRTRRKKIGKGKTAKTETTVEQGPIPQVALVAMDPHTGDVLALVGGRNYGQSQLNHAVAKRPTGSIFKPFVYAAAMNTALTDGDHAVTPASLIDDTPSTFTYGDQIYEPRNYKEEYHGLVTARYALAMSLNNATVKLAEQVGYDRVAQLARAAGIASVKATPAMALGAYDATPLDMTGAYTVFANDGVRLSPLMIRAVHNGQGELIEEFKPNAAQVLDPRVAYIMTVMMESVINNGTAAGVRARGFSAPAAGKTGTSHDAWFAGYTSNLLCVVWVGYDDYSDLRLSGSATAAPIWAEFMKRAVALPHYRDAMPFVQPPGVVDVRLDKLTNRLATGTCPEAYTAAFVAGTEPKETCDQAPGGRSILTRILGLGSNTPPPPPTTNGPVAGRPAPVLPGQQAQADDSKKKKGFFGRIVGIFKDEKDEKQPPPAPPPPARDGTARPR